MVLSERKKVMALLSRRQALEQDLAITPVSADARQGLDDMIPDLLRYFKCDTVEALRAQYPTTADMRTAAEKTRYFAPRKTPQDRVGDIYNNIRKSDEQEYVDFVRMSKTAFNNLVTSVLPQHPVFKNQSNNGQESIEKQLAITLWRMGHFGKDAGVAEASKVFGLSEGTIVKCTQRCLEAFKDIAADVISWPSQGEKQIIKGRINYITAADPSNPVLDKTAAGSTNEPDSDEYRTRIRGDRRGISDAVGILLRIHIPLATRPLMKDPSDFIIPIPPSLTQLVARTQAPTVSSDSDDSASPSRAAQESESTPSNKRQKRRLKSKAITDKRGANKMISASARSKRAAKGKQKVIDTPSPPSDPVWSSTEFTGDFSEQARHSPLSSASNGSTPTASSYLKRDYGFNCLLVCDPTTRIRFADKLQPGSWDGRRVLECSGLIENEATLFDHNDYLVAVDSDLPPCKTIIPPYSETDLMGLVTDNEGMRLPSLPGEEIAARITFNNSLNNVRKRAQDCERMLKARFPSLVGLRIQLKDNPATSEFTRAWLQACVTIHNLVLGDDSSYSHDWDSQLEEIESDVRKLQERQALLMWRREFKPRKRRQGQSPKSAAVDDADDESIDLGSLEETDVGDLCLN
ncbi:hypothetical protein BGZ75_002345 [Mortierella antarctica]|nr:hypothetical protein BGZ75_002345 [Mortierella antarctica]